MAIPLVQVRHKTTGAKTFLPETALRTFPDYVKTPSQKSRDEVPDGTAFPGAGSSDDDQQDISATSSASANTTAKGK